MRRTRDAPLVVAAAGIAEPPRVALARVFVAQARVRGQMRGNARRSMPREIRGRGAAHELRDANPASDQALAADVANADREVDALVDDVHGTIRKLDVEAHLRMAPRERCQRRREMANAERDGTCELERAARCH